MIIEDSELISRVLAYDDQYAFSQIVKKYQSPIRLFLRRLIDERTEIADELAQETFLIAYRKLKTFQGRSQFSTWLYVIAKNQFLQYVRKQKRVIDWHNEEEEFQEIEYNNRIDLETAISKLTAPQRAVITLSYAEGLSQQDVAQILDIPLGTVKTHLLRGKDQLKKILNDYK
jgi:RNA polymerase sigma factor (sigma-70 family)